MQKIMCRLEDKLLKIFLRCLWYHANMRSEIYKIDGTPASVAQDLGIPVIYGGKSETQEGNLYLTKADTPRTAYIDPQATYNDFYQLWHTAAKQENYCFIQGDTKGGAIPNICYQFLILNKKSDLEKAVLKQRSFSFGYLHNNPLGGGFNLIFNIKKPHRWICSVLNKSTVPHNQQHCSIYISGIQFESKKKIISNIDDLLKTLNSVVMADFISYFFLKNSQVNTNFVEYCNKHAIPGTVTKPINLLLQYYGPETLIKIYECKKTICLTRNKPGLFSTPIEEARFNLYCEIIRTAQSHMPSNIPALILPPSLETQDSESDSETPEPLVCDFSF